MGRLQSLRERLGGVLSTWDDVVLVDPNAPFDEPEPKPNSDVSYADWTVEGIDDKRIVYGPDHEVTGELVIWVWSTKDRGDGEVASLQDSLQTHLETATSAAVDLHFESLRVGDPAYDGNWYGRSLRVPFIFYP